MPIEINWLRDYKGGDPERFREYQRKRFRPVEWVDDVIALDEKWRQAVAKIQDMKKAINKLQKDVIAKKIKAKQPCDDEIAQVATMKKEVAELDQQLPVMEAARDKALSKLGNIVDPEVPISEDEDADNSVCRLNPHPRGVRLPAPCGTLKYELPPTKPLKHDDLLWRIGGYDDERGRKVAGHRGYFLTNAGVLLNQALINYSTAFLRGKTFSQDNKKYEVVQPPFFMKKELMAGIAQLEDFDEQLYKVSGKTDDPDGASEKYLIATSEQPMCGYHMGEWLEEKELPKRYAGISTCFRKEAGSSGRDIRGIFRVHQFEKVEQFVLCKDDLETSMRMQKEMIDNACDFYTSLNVPYRVVTICSGALNDAAIKKYDLEGWFPGQEAYRELVSCSNCTDFQSRAMGIRCGAKKMGQTSASFVHMLNSTLCATGRGICALLENNQTADGVVIPKVLRPYMGGCDFLPFIKEPRSDPELVAKSKAEGKSKASKAPKAPSAPVAEKAAAEPAPASSSESPLVAKITAAGDIVRELKAKKASKDEIMAAVAKLNECKAEYKKETGNDYIAPGQQGSSKDKKKNKEVAPATQPAAASSNESPLVAKITAAGDIVRELKAKKASKDEIMAAVAKLNECKAEYKKETGNDYIAPGQQGSSKDKKKSKEVAKDSKKEEKPATKVETKTKPASAGPSGDLTAYAGTVDKALLFQSYVNGYVATSDDANAFKAFVAGNIDAVKAKSLGHPNLARWLAHMGSFTEEQRTSWPKVVNSKATPPIFAPPPVDGALPEVKKVATPTPVKQATKVDEDDELDLGFDDEEEEEAKPAGKSRAEIAKELKAQRDKEAEEKKAAALARLAKKEANQRSLCNLEIKPWESDQDLMELFAKIKRTVVKDGLKWSENCALVDVAFGIKKLVLTAVISLNLSMDAIIEEMTEETFVDEIQSMQMTSMSLL
jgi:seryl-tRNA synthetase